MSLSTFIDPIFSSDSHQTKHYRVIKLASLSQIYFNTRMRSMVSYKTEYINGASQREHRLLVSLKNKTYSNRLH